MLTNECGVTTTMRLTSPFWTEFDDDEQLSYNEICIASKNAGEWNIQHLLTGSLGKMLLAKPSNQTVAYSQKV